MAAKLDVVDYLPTRVVCGDDTYLYAIISDDLYRAESKDDALTICYTHPLGYDISNVWNTSTPGLLFMTCKNLATSKTYLYKSIDYGESWGNNSPSYDNDAHVELIGNVDGTDENHISGCELLGRGFCELNGKFYFAEYNVNGSRVVGGANDQVRVVVSIDNGDTWQTAARWNANGSRQVRHAHGVNTDGDSIYISFGDLSSESGILKWDGVSELVSNQELSEYANCLHGSQTYRTGDVLFPPGSAYMFWMADSSAPDSNRGIFRALRDMSAPAERMNSDITGFELHSGWYGVVVDPSTMVFSEFLESDAPNYQMNFYSTSDGGNTWALVAKYGSADISSGTRGFFLWKDGNLYYERVGAGKDYLCTSVFRVVSKSYAEEFPVILHPVYWVDPSGVNENLRGYRPSDPFASPKYALIASKITHGGRVIVRPGVYDVGGGQIQPDFSAHVRPGFVDAITVVEGHGELNTVIKSSGTTEGVFYIVKAATPFLIKGLAARSEKESITNTVLTVAAHAAPKKGFVYVRDCELGQRIAAANLTVNNLQDLDIARTRVLAANTGMTGVRARANSITKIAASEIIGGTSGIYTADAGADIQALNTTISDYTTRGVLYASAATLVPEIKNCVFLPRAGATGDINDGVSGGLTETDEKIDYNYYGGNLSGMANGGGSHSIIGGDPKIENPAVLNFRLKEDSPLRGAGADVGVDRDFVDEPFAATPSIGAHEYSKTAWGRKSACASRLSLSAQPCKGHALPIGVGKITVFDGVASSGQIEEAK